MQVILVRHGDAVRPVGVADGERWLSARGRAEVASVGARVKARPLAPALLLTSPLVRAVQTAELFAQALGYGGPVQAEAALATGDLDGALRVLEALTDLPSVALVGHEPSIRDLAEALLGEGHIGTFATGTACAIDWDPGAAPGRVLWRIDP